jgi:hypothetical protein
LLFASIPCTGGSSFTHINKHIPSAYKKIRGHVKAMIELLHVFEALCNIAMNSGCLICIEWPTGCVYWRRRDVKALINRYNLVGVKFHGCALGLTGISGGPMFKPWKVMTNCPNIIKSFETVRCHRRHQHEIVAGANTKSSEGYTVDFVAKLHDAFREAVE